MANVSDLPSTYELWLRLPSCHPYHFKPWHVVVITHRQNAIGSSACCLNMVKSATSLPSLLLHFVPSPHRRRMLVAPSSYRSHRRRGTVVASSSHCRCVVIFLAVETLPLALETILRIFSKLR